MLALTYLKPASKLALLVTGALALSACHHGHYYYDDGYGYGGYGGDSYYGGDSGYYGSYDDGYRHHKKKKRHYKYDRYDRYDGRYDDSYRYHRSYSACDPDGDRCYSSNSPYWDYREYYRRHGYSWRD